MAHIELLDQSTIDKIAAGEVVERPASVVKELVENAIDAGASAITVEIKEGGTSLIRITDNGCGIPKEETQVAFLRHSTSKIKHVEDLLTVSSLGFRGEALSSIAAVSSVELITKTKESFTGVRYLVDGGKEISLEEIGAPEGTTFLVRKLFYNTPARRKFLKSPATEAGYINDLVERLALSHPDISFKFINNNQTKLHTSGNTVQKDIIYHVFGREIAGNLIEVNAQRQGIKISGFIGKPVIARGNRNYENYFINGRYVKSSLLAKAIEEGYKTFMMQHKYPFTVLQFEMDGNLLDVNVHPTKMELRFSNQEEIYYFVVETIKNALAGRELIPEVSFVPKKEEPPKQKPIPVPEPFERRRLEKEKWGRFLEESSHTERTVPNLVPQKDANKSNEPNFLESKVEGKDLVKEQPLSYQVKSTQSCISSLAPLQTEGIPREEEKGTNSSFVEKEMNSQKEGNADGQQLSSAAQQLNLFEEKMLSKEARQDYQIIGQLFDTYWIVQFRDKYYIIDQHAAHEKVLYEQMTQSLAHKEFTSQVISPPIILTLTMQEEVLLKQYQKNFEEIGFEIEPFGGKEYSIRAVPDNLFGIAQKELFLEMLDGLADQIGTLNADTISEKIASMSCKAAVKGNNRLTRKEAEALIDKLLTLENPYNCPHGRPTIIAMTKYELEKKFKRIV